MTDACEGRVMHGRSAREEEEEEEEEEEQEDEEAEEEEEDGGTGCIQDEYPHIREWWE